MKAFKQKNGHHTFYINVENCECLDNAFYYMLGMHRMFSSQNFGVRPTKRNDWINFTSNNVFDDANKFQPAWMQAHFIKAANMSTWKHFKILKSTFWHFNLCNSKTIVRMNRRKSILYSDFGQGFCYIRFWPRNFISVHPYVIGRRVRTYRIIWNNY